MVNGDLSAANQSKAGAVGSTPAANRNSPNLLINLHQLLRGRPRGQQGAGRSVAYAGSRSPAAEHGFQPMRAIQILLDRETAAFVHA